MAPSGGGATRTICTARPRRCRSTVIPVFDGKIAETWQVWDTLGFLQQLGVIPTL